MIKKNIFLSGGGSERDSYLLDKAFINLVVKRHAKILYLPIATNGGRIKYESCYDWIINSLTSIENNIFIDIVMWTDLRNKNFKFPENFDAIYIGGGNTFRLLQQIYDTGFFPVIKRFIEEGGIYYGGSAGAIITGKSISTVWEENDNDYKYLTGLDVIGNYSLICHYSKELDDQIHNFVSTFNNKVIALTERTGIQIIGNSAHVLGYEPAIIFDLNREKRIINIGETFII